MCTDSSMAEGQVLFDAVNVGRSKDRGISHPPPAFGILALHQMASARSTKKHFTVRGYLEAFRY